MPVNEVVRRYRPVVYGGEMAESVDTEERYAEAERSLIAAVEERFPSVEARKRAHDNGELVAFLNRYHQDYSGNGLDFDYVIDRVVGAVDPFPEP
jgi:hypothetical protein